MTLHRKPTAPRHAAAAGALAIALAAVLGLSACSKKDDAAAPATQVAAKVGDSEISVHQINQVLSRTPMEAPSQQALQAASRQVLERLIDQQVAVEAATKDNLHRTPEVIAALEAARREVLARAYLQKFSANAPKASPEEVARYYRENPALFAERRSFSLQEVRVPDASAVLPELRSLVAQGQSLDDIAQRLSGLQVPFARGNATRTADQLPLDLLPRIHALPEGQAVLFESGSAATVVRVASAQPAHLTEAEATPLIERFLNNQRLNDSVQQEVKRLRDATTVSYQGEFAQTAAAPAEAPAAPAAAAAPAAPAAAPANVDPATLERGVQGLK